MYGTSLILPRFDVICALSEWHGKMESFCYIVNVYSLCTDLDFQIMLIVCCCFAVKLMIFLCLLPQKKKQDLVETEVMHYPINR